jgi:ABC-type nitrate/sulfonate/bicarbonate transport system substrate-binding protein
MGLKAFKWGVLSFFLSAAPCYATNHVILSFNLGGPYYPAGSIALEAYPHWRETFIGPIPTVMGAIKYGARSGARIDPAMKIVAVMSADQPAHALMVAKTAFDEVASDPATKLPGRKLLLTVSSTAQMFAERCLAGWNVRLDQMVVEKGEQAEIRGALSAKKADVAVLWTPFVHFSGIDSEKAKVLPCPNLGSLDIPSFIVARADLLNDPDPMQPKRKQVAAFVAKALGSWALAAENPGDAAKRLVATYREEIKDPRYLLTEAEAHAEIEARRPPDLDGQRTLFKAPVGGATPLAIMLDPIMDFMVASGTLKLADRPAAADLLDSSILELIASDAELNAIARGKTAP